jgi:CheY-like chemotaxis protein
LSLCTFDGPKIAQIVSAPPVVEEFTETRRMSTKPPGNVLVVEDDLDTAEMILTLLNGEGYHVRCVPTRDAALLTLGTALFDLIIMDFMMPGLGAIEFLNIARRQCPTTTIILTTASTIAAEHASKLGINRWVGKPFTPEELVQTIRYSPG